MTQSIQTIRVEHFNIATVLSSLTRMVAEIDDGHRAPDFDLLAAILDYMEAFPDTFHHPKEEDLLFVHLEQRWPDGRPALDRLRDEHARLLELLEDVRLAMVAYQRDSLKRRDFIRAVRLYTDLQRRHMAYEERTLLPVALRLLTDEDWAAIDEGFARNDDPLFGTARAARLDALFHEIIEQAASPYAVPDVGSDAESDSAVVAK